MHLLIIAQYLNHFGPEEDRLWKLGRHFVESGNEVTIITGVGGRDFKLGGKMIGLTKENGVNLITFNIPYSATMEHRRKMSAFIRFKRLAERQGRQLPKPDFILALSPPLTALMPALKLSDYYSAPLVIEIRELWPDAPIQRGTLKNFILVRMARKFEEKIYEQADCIIAGSKGIADAVKERWVERAKISTLPQMDDENEILETYNNAIANISKSKKL